MQLKVLFLLFHGFSMHNGISKKIWGQVKGLKSCGADVKLCYYEVMGDGHRAWMVDESVLHDFGTGVWAKLRRRFDFSTLVHYVRQEKFDLVYMRSDHNANPFTISLVNDIKAAGSNVIMEIPTYPYDREYDGHRAKPKLYVDRLFRRKLASRVDAIVTFSDYDYIFGQKTIKISNGIDFDTIPLRNPFPKKEHVTHLVAVAEIHYWHGFDRVIEGLARYKDRYSGHCVIFHLVGGLFGEREKRDILQPIQKYGLEEQVILYGPLAGQELDEIFDKADFAIGSLGRHRTGITRIKTLKNREYAARGIPFMYSENDTDFDDQDFVLKATADESPIDIAAILDFIAAHQFIPKHIREVIQHLSWEHQMQDVLDYRDKKLVGYNEKK